MQRGIFLIGIFLLALAWFTPSGRMQTNPTRPAIQPQDVPPTIQGTPWLNIEDTAGMQVKIVRNTNASGPDSLPALLDEANREGGNCWIQFQIPRTDQGFETRDIISYWRIKLQRAIPITANRIFIDGFSQTQFAGNTNPNGPELLIDGTAAKGAGGEFFVTGNQTWIRGLCVIVNQSSVGGIADTIDISRASFARSGATAVGNRLNDNYLSVNPDGETLPVGDAGGITLDVGAQDTLVENNVICGNATNIWISGSFRFRDAGIPYHPAVRNIIRGNKIGTNAAGTKRLSPPSLALDGDRLPYRAIDLEFANCAENIIENNIIA
ncbi:MAG TPA: hypothetical protein PKE58_00530, partial [Acidobacteriota bacterium]|nr:hypothetical protein [Acidobacteriota bacterium]